MTQEYLFIGGPADGKRIKIHDGQDEYCIPMYEPINHISGGYDLMELGFNVVRYSKHEFRSGVSIFADQNMSGDDVIKMLIQGYNPKA